MSSAQGSENKWLRIVAGGAMVTCGAVIMLNWRKLARVSHGMKAGSKH